MLAEGGIGWIPFLIERAEHVATDYRYLRARTGRSIRPPMRLTQVPTDPEIFPRSPRQLFNDHMYGCFIEDDFGAANLDSIGIDNVMIETDYPHTDSLWPNSLQAAHKALDGRSDLDKYKVLQGNARRIFDFEPAPYPTVT